jgi:hypothetical protein
MMKKGYISSQTRNNWLIDAVVFFGVFIASITGIYFLFLPVGGYQGGRNPMYGIRILFERSTWDDLHMWSGIIMIAAAVVHIAIHWQWITSMAIRMFKDLFRSKNKLNNRSRFNVVINATIGISFLIAAMSGIYLLFFPGGAHGVADPMWIFTRTTWDLIHTWAGVLMIVAALIHFLIHWKWITKVTRKFILSIVPSR